MNKVGVCDWLLLYYHAGMYTVPFCYIAVHCDKERLGYLRNLGSLSRNQTEAFIHSRLKGCDSSALSPEPAPSGAYKFRSATRKYPWKEN